MSYSLILSFCEVKNELDAFHKALDTVKYYKTVQGQDEIIDEIVGNEIITCDQINDPTFLEGLIYKHFRYKFVYFKKLNILAYNGKCQKIFPVSIHFQDSTDQDYDDSVWNGISYFEDIISRSKKLSRTELRDFFFEYGYGAEDFEEQSDFEYFKKSFVYKTVFADLHLEDYLYLRDHEDFHSEDFESFVLSGMDSPYDIIRPKTMLKNRLNNMQSLES